MTTLTVNGHSYTEADMENGGFRTNLFPMLSNSVTDFAAKVSSATTQAGLAAASAATAATAPGTAATSTTSLAVGTGAKSLTIQTGKSLVVGMWVIVADTADPATNWMAGQVTSYTSGTGALEVLVTATGGSGTKTAWTVSLSGVSGGGNVVGPGSAVSGNLPVFDGTTGKILADSGQAPWSLAQLHAIALSF